MPELHYLRLPRDISEDHVILIDRRCCHGVCTGPVGPRGAGGELCSAVDKTVDNSLQVIPGIGDFGDRYFVTDGGASGWSNHDEQERPRNPTGFCET
ncbi:hypothetical protein DPEC_G00011200 [Dallia pectoralis]|uniref:Uncharacterized protein n=1 Tax=Dallia pectoralis TaxID=75939 RepID=A0ACC2HMW5_DALPE|nr:hypothetical protein DPEC_G00011200 [Dallia pectoralis]